MSDQTPDPTPKKPSRRNFDAANKVNPAKLNPLGYDVTLSAEHKKANAGNQSILAGIDPDAPVALRMLMAAREEKAQAEALAEKAAADREATKPRVVVIGGVTKRPKSKFTPQLRDQYLDLLRQAVPPHKAARQLGMSSSLVSAAKKADPAFAEACRDALEEAMEGPVEVQYRNAMDGDLKAAEWLGKILAPHIYDPSKKVDVKVDGQIESLTAGDRAAQIERIAALQERLTARLALRAAGDAVEAEIEEAELVDDAPHIEELEE